MSALTNLKSFVLRAASNEEPELKEALLDLFLAIDSDLEDGYVPSTDVDEAIENLDRVLIKLGKEQDKIQIEDAELVRKSETGDLPESIKKDDSSE